MPSRKWHTTFVSNKRRKKEKKKKTTWQPKRDRESKSHCTIWLKNYLA